MLVCTYPGDFILVPAGENAGVYLPRRLYSCPCRSVCWCVLTQETLFLSLQVRMLVCTYPGDFILVPAGQYAGVYLPRRLYSCPCRSVCWCVLTQETLFLSLQVRMLVCTYPGDFILVPAGENAGVYLPRRLYSCPCRSVCWCVLTQETLFLSLQVRMLVCTYPGDFILVPAGQYAGVYLPRRLYSCPCRSVCWCVLTQETLFLSLQVRMLVCTYPGDFILVPAGQNAGVYLPRRLYSCPCR